MQLASTAQPLKVPSLRKRDAWDGEASTELIALAVTRALIQCGLKSEDVTVSVANLSSLIASRGYTPAEMAYAAQELPFDQEIDWKKKQGFEITAADFERHVAALRRLRATLQMKLRTIDVNKIVQEFPRLVSVDDFGLTGEAGPGEPLYRFSFMGKPPKKLQMMQLPEPAPVTRDREDAGTFTMQELVQEYQNKPEAA